jgi:hypothetical protein
LQQLALVPFPLGGERDDPIPLTALWRVAGEPDLVAYQRDSIDTVFHHRTGHSSGGTGSDSGGGGGEGSVVRINGKGVVGVAPPAILHPVMVLKRNGMGFGSDIIAGIDWITGQAKASAWPVVANASLGGSGSKSGTCSGTTGYTGTDVYHKAYCEARLAGVVFVVAAGNSGADAASSVPAAYTDADLTVFAPLTKGCGNYTCDDWPTWSNWGDDLSKEWSDQYKSSPVFLAAPGVDIESTWIKGGFRGWRAAGEIQSKRPCSAAHPYIATRRSNASNHFALSESECTTMQAASSRVTA